MESAVHVTRVLKQYMMIVPMNSNPDQPGCSAAEQVQSGQPGDFYDSTDRRWPGIRGAGRMLIAFVVFLALARLVQYKAGAEGAAFGQFPDEPAHFVGGVMVRDYLVTALGQNPVGFARDYYLRLPYFALGVWPPFFYGLEAA
jgi:hypothetical protein